MMPSDSIAIKLGFDSIRFLVAGQCLCRKSSELAMSMDWQTDESTINRWMQENQEMMKLIQQQQILIQNAVPDITGDLAMLSMEGSVLETDGLHRIRKVIQEFKPLHKTLSTLKEELPSLWVYISGIEDLNSELSKLNNVLDIEGNIKPGASPELSLIEKRLQRARSEIGQKIQREYDHWKSAGILADTEVTVRDGRPVLPVLSEHRRKIHGYIHGESGNGRICYIEPGNLIEANNLLAILESEKKREVERILRQLCRDLRPAVGKIGAQAEAINQLDFIQAKSIFGRSIQAKNPEIVQNQQLNLRQAFHPLLFLKNKGEGIVRQDILLNTEERIMVISGPNGGGKSITLKTIGLIQFMWQSGLPIPAGPDSSLSVFNEIFMVIGDSQSVQDHLSTYTSHLKNIRHILENVNTHSLVLIDELGDGTDPSYGGPMAYAILQELSLSQCMGVVTTHFSLLKEKASSTPGLFNASMGYDNQALKPLFTLNRGIAGSSYTFEAAQMAGIDAEIIEKARQYTDLRMLNLDITLAQAQESKFHYQVLLEELKRKEILADRLIQEYQLLKGQIQDHKKNFIDQARENALTIIENANREVEHTIKSIKESKGNSENTKAVKKNLEIRRNELRKQIGIPVQGEKRNSKPISSTFEKGDFVRIKGSVILSEITEIKGDQATITNGQLMTRISLNKLEKANPEEKRLNSVQKLGENLLEKQKEFRPEADVRGMRTEACLKFIEKWLDEAHVLGYHRLRIIHGKGDGILQKQIRNYFRSQSVVQNIFSELPELGGDGVTIIELQV